MSIKTQFQRLAADQAGATAIEYALIIALISLGILGSAGGLGDALGVTWDHIKTSVGNATGTSA